MWAARLLPASQQRRFAGAGGKMDPRAKHKTRSRSEHLQARAKACQTEILRLQEDYVSAPVRTPDDPTNPWKRMADGQCMSCSRRPLATFCHKCGIGVCGSRTIRQEVAPYKWMCIDCASPSDVSEEQNRLLVACQNEDVQDRRLIVARPDPEGDGLAAALAKRMTGDSGRQAEVAWWAEIKRKDWGALGERPVMPMASVKRFLQEGRNKEEKNEGGAEKLEAASSKDPCPHPVKEEPKGEREENKGPRRSKSVTAKRKQESKETLGRSEKARKKWLDQDEEEEVDDYVKRLIAGYKEEKGNEQKGEENSSKEAPEAESRKAEEKDASKMNLGKAPPSRPGGPAQPPKTRSRGSANKAMEVARSESLMKEARLNYGALVYSKSTASAKDSKVKLFVQVAEARNLQPFPFTPAVIAEVAAVLRAADFASGATYLAEAKQLHIRKSYAWSEELDLAMQDAERALTRALGPPTKAAEIRPELWSEWTRRGKVGFERKPTQPDGGPELWCLGSAFLLREVELAHLRIGSISVDKESKQVTALLSMSKTDPRGMRGEPGHAHVEDRMMTRQTWTVPSMLQSDF